MKSYSSREVIKMLKTDGWYEFSVTGDHYHFKHPTKPGKDLNPATLRSIQKQAGLTF